MVLHLLEAAEKWFSVLTAAHPKNRAATPHRSVNEFKAMYMFRQYAPELL